MVKKEKKIETAQPPMTGKVEGRFSEIVPFQMGSSNQELTQAAGELLSPGEDIRLRTETGYPIHMSVLGMTAERLAAAELPKSAAVLKAFEKFVNSYMYSHGRKSRLEFKGTLEALMQAKTLQEQQSAIQKLLSSEEIKK